MPRFDDEIWKRSIHTLFKPMVRFYFPDLHLMVDWEDKKPAFLEEELANLFGPENAGKRYVDILTRVFLKDGSDKFILLHVEVQGYGSGDRDAKEFEMRMFQYYYRIWDKWKSRDIIALAILTDDNDRYRPVRYHHEFYGTRVTYEFNVSKVMDCDEEELTADTNPFATLMLAAKKALKVRRSDDETKKIFKLSLIRMGLTKGYTEEELRSLFYFVDWAVQFSGLEAKREFVEEVRALAKKEERAMPYVTSIEEITKEETMEEARLEFAFTMLAAGEPDVKILAYAKISPEELAGLKQRVSQDKN